MNIIDIMILVLLVLGAYNGHKKGIFRSGISLIGTIVIVVIAFFLKNPISQLMYENLPFFSFKGALAVITFFNILLYEAIAYIICLIILTTILHVVITVSGVADKLIEWTFVLRLPAKIFGTLFGMAEVFVYTYMVLFVLSQIPATTEYIQNSKFANPIIEKTPILNSITKDVYSTVKEVYKESSSSKDKENADVKTLEILLKYDIITPESVKKLAEKKKLKIENTDEIIKKYEEKTND